MEREITSHKVNGLNEALTIRSVDEQGAGGAYHQYEISGPVEGDGVEPVCCEIKFQKGPIQEAGVNGISQETLLAIIEDRLQCFQDGPYACESNAVALDHVRKAIEVLHSRTKERMSRGVEGTSKIAILLCCLLSGIGCDTVFPPSPPKVIEIQAPAFNDDQDILAFNMAQAIPNVDPNIVPTPSDCPKVGDVCPNYVKGSGPCLSGDGLKADRFCGGDGRMDASDPGITECSHSSPQETTEEHSIVKEYLLKEEFEKAYSDQEAAIAELKENVDSLNTELDAEAEAVQDLSANKAADEALTARVNELEAKLAALDERCICGKQPPASAVQTEYHIQYEGIDYVWDEASRSFVGPGTRRITFPHLGPIEQQAKVKVCVGDYCTETEVRKVDKQIQSTK